MSIVDLGPKAYFRYRVDCRNNPQANRVFLETIQDWAEENKIVCTLLPGSAYFVQEKDAIWFTLKWL